MNIEIRILTWSVVLGFVHITELLFLEAEDPEKDIYLYINSSVGSVLAGLGIYDTMNHLQIEPKQRYPNEC